MGRLKSFFYMSSMAIETPLLLIFFRAYNLGYVSLNLYILIWLAFVITIIYRTMCYLLDIGIAERINDYFVFLNLPYTNLVLIHQKVKNCAIKNISCKEKTKRLLNTPNDIIPKLRESKVYITFTHDEIVSRIERIRGINVKTKKIVFSKSLSNILEQIYQCRKKRCKKYNKCFYVDSNTRNFYFLKFNISIRIDSMYFV